MRAIELPNDERLLIEAAQLDPNRFGELYDLHVDRVFGFVMHRVKNRQEAEDITAEVFHQALAHIARYEWRGLPFRSWLMRIAVNAVNDRWQRKSREPLAANDAAHEAAIDYEVERRAMLAQLVGRLPEDQRTVVVRRFMEDRSIREIATAMDRSEGAVKQLQLRAMENLRGMMRKTHV